MEWSRPSTASHAGSASGTRVPVLVVSVALQHEEAAAAAAAAGGAPDDAPVWLEWAGVTGTGERAGPWQRSKHAVFVAVARRVQRGLEHFRRAGAKGTAGTPFTVEALRLFVVRCRAQMLTRALAMACRLRAVIDAGLAVELPSAVFRSVSHLWQAAVRRGPCCCSTSTHALSSLCAQATSWDRSTRPAPTRAP